MRRVFGVLAIAALVVAVAPASAPFLPQAVRALSGTPEPTEGASQAPDPTRRPSPTQDPGASPTPRPSRTPRPSPTPDQGASPTPAPSPTAPGDASHTPGPPATPPSDPAPTPASTSTPAAGATPVTTPVTDSVLRQSTDGPGSRIDPGALLAVNIDAQLAVPIADAELVETIPAGWAVVDADGARWDGVFRQLSWSAPILDPASGLTRRIVVRAPETSPTGPGAAFESAFGASLAYRTGALAAPDLTIVVAPRIIVEHFVTAIVDRDSGAVVGGYLPIDQAPPALDVPAKFRLRFQVRNVNSLPLDWTPLLQFRPVGAADWTAVPAREYHNGVAFFVSPEAMRRQADPRLADVPAGPEEREIAPASLEVSAATGPTSRPRPVTAPWGRTRRRP